MSTNYAARALVGIRLTRGEVVRAERVKTFDHDFPSNWKVDPTTGNDLWMTRLRCVLMPEIEDFDASLVVPRPELDGLCFFDDGNDEHFLLGDFAAEDDPCWPNRLERAFCSLTVNAHLADSIRQTRERIRRVLKKAGLPFEESRFGLHVLLYVSR